jgi:GNAT superfamily N-acetyltransferase
MLFARPATLADLAAIQAFDEFRQMTADIVGAGGCFVAGFDGVPLAYALVSRHFYGRRFIELLLVQGPHRRRGLASALLDSVEKHVPNEPVWISTAADNYAMHALLAHRGYQPAGIIHGLAKQAELIYRKDVGGAGSQPQ